MILVDTNIFMYAAGAAHPRKDPSTRFLQLVAAGTLEAAIDTEVLQEILHRYRSIGRWETGRRVFDMASIIAPEVIPVTLDHMKICRMLMDEHAGLETRDGVHAAVYRKIRAESLCSYDRDFDSIPFVRRRTPEDLADA